MKIIIRSMAIAVASLFLFVTAALLFGLIAAVTNALGAI